MASCWGSERQIEDAFEDQGFQAGRITYPHGELRGLFKAYEDAIDWEDYDQVILAIRVFQEILSWGDEMVQEYTSIDEIEYWEYRYENYEKMLAKLRQVLDEYGGLTLEDDGRLRLVSHYQKVGLPLESIHDPASIKEHLGRIDPGDPAAAISSAKSLVEATCKCVLKELKTPYKKRDNIQTLAKSVQKALKVHPDMISEEQKGRDTIVRTLSSLTQIVVGIAELRNEYGIDHGRSRYSGGLTSRHARLATGAAHTYCYFLLETLDKHQSRNSLPQQSEQNA